MVRVERTGNRQTHSDKPTHALKVWGLGGGCLEGFGGGGGGGEEGEGGGEGVELIAHEFHQSR